MNHQSKIYFLSFDGPPVSDQISRLMFSSAQTMLREKDNRFVIKEDYCEGVVTTEWKLIALGNLYGYRFTATIEWGNRTSTIHFLGRKNDLNIEEMGSFYVPQTHMPTPREINLN